MSKRSLAVAAGMALIAVLVLAFMFTGRKAKAGSDDEAQATPAAVAVVRRKPLQKSVALSGEFVPFQQVDVHAKVAGYISKIFVDVGDHVNTGQTLAILEVPELQAQLQGAGASVHRAEDGIRRAQSDITRAKSVHEATHLDYTRLEQASQARP